MSATTISSLRASAKHAKPRRRRQAVWPMVIAGVVVAPLLAVAAAALAPAPAWRHILGTVLADYAVNALLLGLGVALIAASAGAISAWLVVAFAFPGRRVAEVALLLPLAVPTYIAGYVWTDLLDVAGPVQGALRAATGLGWGAYWFPEIRTLPGAAVVMGLVLYPYVYLTCRAAFLQQSVCLLEAARTLGHGPARTFLHVALPLARPAIAGGVALVLMETWADYGTVRHFGVPVFVTGIADAWFGMGDRAAASRLALCLLLLVGLMLAAERAARGPRRFHPTTTRHPPLRAITLTGAKAWLALLACALPPLLGFGLPAARLLWFALTEGDPLPLSAFLPFARNALLLAVAAGLVATFLAWVLAWSARQHPGGATRAAMRIAGLGYAVPGAVVAVGALLPLALLDNTLDGWVRAALGVSTGLLLSGTAFALVFAYVARFLAVALASVDAGLQRQKPSLLAAARVLGRQPRAAAREVALPLAKPHLIAAFLLVFVDTLKELPATLIVRPFDFDTLAIRVFNLASDERLAQASTAALLIVLAGLIPVVVLTRAMRARD